jgi:hypothetical protein
MSVEHRMHGADGRQQNIATAVAQLLADLGSTPAGVLPLELDD